MKHLASLILALLVFGMSEHANAQGGKISDMATMTEPLAAEDIVHGYNMSEASGSRSYQFSIAEIATFARSSVPWASLTGAPSAIGQLSGIGVSSGRLIVGGGAGAWIGLNVGANGSFLGVDTITGVVGWKTSVPWSTVSKSGSSLADLTTRSASDLTTGILDIARIGTGTRSIYTFLRGDGQWTLGSAMVQPLLGSISVNEGAMLFYNGTVWTELSPGTEGHVLTTHTDAAPTWEPPSGGGLSPWTIVTTSGGTLVSGGRYQVDTSAIGITLYLPAAPNVGDEIIIEDAKFSWANRNVIIGRNGRLIGGVATSYIANVSGGKLTCVYISAGYGWSIK